MADVFVSYLKKNSSAGFEAHTVPCMVKKISHIFLVEIPFYFITLTTVEPKTTATSCQQ